MGRASSPKTANVLIRFDARRKATVRRAAALRGLSVSDYVRSRIVSLAERDLEEAETGVLRLGREAQLSLWRALQNPPPPTKAQRALGELIRSVT
ncbi:MAG: DUF1778 domain-containing protein [Myxococcaceae bacterium]|nr:DUF1778 domain-containing protein [Myxococcaceae bacterium]